MTADTTTVALPAPSRWQRFASMMRRALFVELRVYSSIGRAIARRPAVPRGGTGIRYHQPLLTILIVFIVLSAVEIPIIDLIVHRWPGVRIAFLILGIWGLTWMLGLLCAMLMRPHAVAPEGILIRGGLEIDVAISKRIDEPKQPRITEGSNGWEYAERVLNETNIVIELERPFAVRLPGLQPRGGEHLVTSVRLWADDPRALIAASRPFLLAAD